MEMKDVLVHAKKGQKKLRDIKCPAQHIYFVGSIEEDSPASLIFVSSAFNNVDLYERAKIAGEIRNGPLKLNFYIVGPKHLVSAVPFSRGRIFNAIKLYGKKPLILDDLEYASYKDAEMFKIGTANSHGIF